MVHVIIDSFIGDVGRELMMSVLCAHPLDVALTPHTRHVVHIAIIKYILASCQHNETKKSVL